MSTQVTSDEFLLIDKQDSQTQVEYCDFEILNNCVETQVSNSDLSPIGSIANNIKTDKALSTATGIESFEVFNSIVAIAAKVSKHDNHNTKMTLQEKIFMTYMKLKQNVSYAFLALLFNSCTEQHCKRIFFETIQLLSAVLKVFISWPDREEIKRNLPKCFEDFEDVAVVLDCTEIYIQH